MIGDFGHERQRRSRDAMAAGFRALRHNDIGPGLNRFAGMGHVLHLTDQDRAGGFGPLGERKRRPEGEHDRGRRIAQDLIQQPRVSRKRPGNKSAADPRVAGLRKLAFEPFRVAVTAADEAKAAGRRDRRRKLSAGRRAHRRQHDRVLDAETVGQPGTEHHR